jgi:hypothetical protein
VRRYAHLVGAHLVETQTRLPRLREDAGARLFQPGDLDWVGGFGDPRIDLLSDLGERRHVHRAHALLAIVELAPRHLVELRLLLHAGPLVREVLLLRVDVVLNRAIEHVGRVVFAGAAPPAREAARDHREADRDLLARRSGVPKVIRVDLLVLDVGDHLLEMRALSPELLVALARQHLFGVRLLAVERGLLLRPRSAPPKAGAALPAPVRSPRGPSPSTR